MDMFSVFGRTAVFTVSEADASRVAAVLGRSGIDFTDAGPCVKVSIVGAGMHGLQGVMARFSSALERAGVDMLQTVDSHATISALVMLDQRDCTLAALHAEFVER
jgi:aspartate kinase